MTDDDEVFGLQPKTPLYTLEAARRELARRECVERGHDWSILSTGGDVPVRIACDCCYDTYAVTPLNQAQSAPQAKGPNL